MHKRILCWSLSFKPLNHSFIVNGNWADWAQWGTCSLTCNSGTGSRSRSRTCTNPAPANNGIDCVGSGTETGTCTVSTPCPSKIVSTKKKHKIGVLFKRFDNAQIHVFIRFFNFEVDGQWGSWSAWNCSRTCGNGVKTRSRDCDNPVPQHGGADCPGNNTDSDSCWAGTCYPSALGNLDKVEMSPKAKLRHLCL